MTYEPLSNVEDNDKMIADLRAMHLDFEQEHQRRQRQIRRNFIWLWIFVAIMVLLTGVNVWLRYHPYVVPCTLTGRI
jgi:hypothetical protein